VLVDCFCLPDCLISCVSLNGRAAAPPHPGQCGCPGLIPGLRAIPLWDTSSEEFSWVRELEKCFPIIKDEFIQLRRAARGSEDSVPSSGIRFQVQSHF
jgi:hypothetical protein